MKKSLKRLILQACYAVRDLSFSENDSSPGHWMCYQTVRIGGFSDGYYDTVSVDMPFSGEREVKSFLRGEFESLM